VPEPLRTVKYVPHQVQSDFHQDPRPSRWFCAGYGVGKTTVGVIEAFTLATITHPGYTGIVVAPTYPLLMQAWFTEWETWIPRAWWTHRRDNLEGNEIRIRTPDGQTSTILLRSTSNPVSNEGVNAAWLVFDEAPRERNPAGYNVLQGRLRRGYPGRQRCTILTGPPQAKRHWTAEEFGTGPDAGKGRPGTQRTWGTATHAVHRARTRDNPYLPPDYETRLRIRPGASAAWCKQYLDAEFGALEGAIYQAFSRDVHVVPAASLRGRSWALVAAGVDWGWAHPGVMLVGGMDGEGNVYVLAEEVHQHKTVSMAADGWGPIGQRLAQAHRVNRWFCDPSLPGNIEVLQQSLRGSGGIVYPADNDVAEGIRRVVALMEGATEAHNRKATIVRPGAYRPGAAVLGTRRPGLYISDACTRLIDGIENYARKKDRDGQLTEQPEKKGDDEADGLRYLVMGVTTP
jgi:hypothetical protein